MESYAPPQSSADLPVFFCWSRPFIRYNRHLFYRDFPVLPYYHIVGFVDVDGAIVSEDRQHSEAHTKVRGQESVAEDGFELVVVGAGILDTSHSPN